MAKKCMIARDKVRTRMSNNARTFREKLKNIVKSISVTTEEKMEAVTKLNKKPRDQSQCRVRRRCNCCGRPHGVYRKYGLCRMCLRKAAMRGDIPGLVKSSW